MKKIISITLIVFVLMFASINTLEANVQNTESTINETGVGFSLNERNTSFFTSFGDAYIYGKNIYGQMGTGNKLPTTQKVDVKTLLNLTNETVVSISQSYQHTLVVTSQGKVFAFGANFYGGFGNDTTTESLTPVNVTSHFTLAQGEKIVKVRAGQGFSLALSNLGSVFSFGYNGTGFDDGGKLGTGDYISYKTPQNITEKFNLNPNEVITDIQAGSSTAGFVTNQGRLFITGPSSYYTFYSIDPKYNSNVPLDITAIFNLDPQDKIVQIDLQVYQMMVLTELGRVFVTGMGARGGSGLAIGTEANQTEPYELSADMTFNTNEKVIDLGLGMQMSGLLTNQGRFFVFGFNDSGQLGMGISYPTNYVLTPILHTNDVWKTDPSETIVEIDAGASHMGFISSLGNVYLFGKNDNLSIDPSVPQNTNFYDPILVYQAPLTKTIQVLDNDGNVLLSETRVEGSSLSDITLPTAPSITGYTFTGWSASIPATLGTEDITITPIYIINQYTITFDSDGGSEVSAITDDFNKTVVRPSDPTKVGYTFAGWDKVIPSVMPAEDITIKAIWDLTNYTITYNLNGGINPLLQPTTFTIVSNAITLLEPTKAGYTFSGWFDQETGGVKVETIPTGSSSNQTLYARFTADAYTLTYNLDGGVNGLNPASYTVEDQTITLLPATKEGHTFNGWYLESSYTTLVTQINPADTKNIALYARFTINTYTITFDTDGGSLIPPITQEFNSAITAPANPSKEGYTFTGWDKAVPVTMPAENSTLIANFEAISYTITFDSDGGSLVSAITQGFETVVTKPSDPTLEGFTFVGWFTDKESLITPFVFDTMPLDGASLYAKWSRDTYTITVISSISDNGFTTLLPGEFVVKARYSGRAGIILTNFNRIFVTGQSKYYGFIVPGFEASDRYISVPTLATSDVFNTNETVIDFDLQGFVGIVLTSDQRVFTFGNPVYGQIGDGNTTNGDIQTLTDITSRLKGLMGQSETIKSVHSGDLYQYVITSTNRVIAWGGSSASPISLRPFYNRNTQPINNSSVPIDVTAAFPANQPPTYVSFLQDYSIFSSGNNHYYRFQNNIAITIPNPLQNESIVSIHAASRSDNLFVARTTLNRLIVLEYKFSEGAFRFVQVKAINTLNIILLPNETVISIHDKLLSAERGIVVLTSEGRLIELLNVTSATEDPTINYLTLPTMNDGEKFVEYSSDYLSNNYTLRTNLGRVFGFGSNRVVGAGLDVPPQSVNVVITPAPVELFKVSKLSGTYQFLYDADLKDFKLEDQNDLFFRGFYTDAALTERFTLTEMPSTNLTLYPLFSPIVNFDLSGIKWIEEAVKIYNGTDYTVTIDETTLPLGLTVLEYKNHINKNVGTYTIEVVFGFDPLTHFEPTLTHTYTITKATYDLSSIVWSIANEVTYTGSAFTATIQSGLDAGLTPNYTNQTYTNAGTYKTSVTFNYDQDNYETPILGDFNWTILKATYDLSSIVWSIPNEVTYTGSAFTATIQSGLDAGLTPNYTNQTYTNAGTYKTSVTFNYDQDNYETPILGDFNWTILKATYDLSNIIWSMEDTVTYNGQSFSPSIVSGLPEGVTVTYRDQTFSQTGNYVTQVDFTYDTDNYNIPLLSFEWTIEKATFDMSQVSWIYDGPFKENEDVQGVTLRNLPLGVTATYTNNMFRLPGTYIATVTYQYDQANYNTLVEPTLTWIIIPTYVYNFIVDGQIIFSQRAEVSDPVDVPEVSKEGYLFKGFDKVVPEVFGNANQDFTATFILLDNVDDTHEKIDVLNAIDLSAFTNTDINIDTVILKTTSEALDEPLRKSYKQVFDSIQAPQLFDFKKLGFTEVKLVISIITNGQTTTVTQLKEGVLVTVYLNEELKGLEGFEIVDLNSKERIQSTYNPETHTMTFVMTQLGAYGLTYQMFDIIPVLVIIAIILFLIILYLLLKRRKKDKKEVETVIKTVVKPTAVQTQKEPEVLKEVLKVDAVVIPGVTSRPTYIGGAKVDSGYYLEVTKDFDSTNRIIDVEDELLPHVLTNGNAFIKISQGEVALLSLKGLSAFGLLKKTPGSKGEKGYYAEVDLVNIFTGRTIILVEKLPPTSKKGHRWVRVQTRVIK